MDIDIEYPGAEDPIEDVMYLPKFTFTFLGTKELYDGFGKIDNTSHPFELVSDSGYKWLGYLTPDVFSMPNTGYREQFSMNGISQVEALKFLKFPFEEYGDDLLNVVQNIVDIIKNNTQITEAKANFVWNSDVLNAMFVAPECFSMNDDDSAHISMYEAIEWTCSSLGLRVILNRDNTVDIWDLIDLFRSGTEDYSKVKHAGIDETFNTGEKIESVIVTGKEARVEISNINLTLPAIAREFGQLEIAIQQGKKLNGWGNGYGSRTPWHTYYRYIGYFQKEEFDGWMFPHYDKVGQEIDEWWNLDKIFSIEQGFRVPLPGAYPMIYKIDNEDWQSALVTIGVYQQHRGSMQPMPVTVNMEGKPCAVYKKKIAAGNGDYLCIDGSIIGSMCTLNDMHKNGKGRNLFDWKRFAFDNMTRSEWETNGNYYDHYSWRVCPCPLICESGSDADEDDDATWRIFNSCHWLWASVRFGNLCWNGESKEWVPFSGTIPKFDILTGKKKEKKGDLIFQQPYPIEKRIDKTSEKVDGYFEKVTGYRLELPKGYKELEITLYFPKRGDYEPEFMSYPTLFLPNLKLLKINIYNDSDFFEKVNMSYHCGPDENTFGINSKKYDSCLTSYKENMFESFLSTLYKDSAGLEPVTLSAWRYTQTRSIVERPEQRIARIVLYYLSKMKTVSDVLPVENSLLSYLYGDDHLWENGCNRSPLRDTVDASYCYNILTYGTDGN